MTEDHSNSNSDERASKAGNAAKQLSDGDIARLILASSLSATKPLQGLIMFLVQEGILDGARLKAFLEPMLALESFPPETRAMLAPIWKALITEIGASNQPASTDVESAKDG